MTRAKRCDTCAKLDDVASSGIMGVSQAPLMTRYPNKSSDAIRIRLAEADASLRDEHAALMDELMRRAMAQNPDIVKQLQAVEQQQDNVRDMRRANVVRQYEEMQEHERQERIASRKRRYDDKRNINALSALRRSYDYKDAPRIDQIKQELEKYYNPRGLEPPQTLLDELYRLTRKDMLKAS